MEVNNNEEDEDEKLSLFDLMAKMQQNLASATKSIMANPVIAPVGVSHTSQLHKTNQVENPRDYEYIENMHDNLNYSLWTVQGQQKSSKPTRVLVRQSTDGYVNTETSSLNVKIYK